MENRVYGIDGCRQSRLEKSMGENGSIKVGTFENGARAKRVRMRHEDAPHSVGVSERGQSTRWEEEKSV